jgi:hypothetical protein
MSELGSYFNLPPSHASSPGTGRKRRSKRERRIEVA